MAKFYPIEKFNLEAGPQIGYLVSAEGEYSLTGGGFDESDTEDIKDDFNTVDFSLNFGAGYDFTENISAGIRYNMGLSQLQKELGGEKASKNSVFQFSVAYAF